MKKDAWTDDDAERVSVRMRKCAALCARLGQTGAAARLLSLSAAQADQEAPSSPAARKHSLSFASPHNTNVRSALPTVRRRYQTLTHAPIHIRICAVVILTALLGR